MEITKNLIFYQCPIQEEKSRNLVILFSWIGAHDKPIRKYVNFYLLKQSNVLVVKMSLFEGLWPTNEAQVI